MADQRRADIACHNAVVLAKTAVRLPLANSPRERCMAHELKSAPRRTVTRLLILGAVFLAMLALPAVSMFVLREPPVWRIASCH